MRSHDTPQHPRLAYQPGEAWGGGVFLSLLNLEEPARFPFKASRFVIEPGATSPPDEHTVAEIWMTASGTGRLLYGERTYPMNPGDVFYIEPGTTHQAVNTSTSPLEIFSVWWSPATP